MTDLRKRLPDLLTAGVLLFCVGLGGFAVYKAFRDHPDWMHWEEETVRLTEEGRTADNTALYGYLPGAVLMLAPFAAWTPKWLGAPLFVLSNLAALAAAVWAVGRWWTGPAEAARPWHSRWAAGLLLLLPVSLFDPLFANQMSFWILGLIGVGLPLVMTGRGFAGGFLLGAAAVVKPIPGLLVLFCAWKRRWSAVGGAIAAGVVLDLLPCVVFFGWFAPAVEGETRPAGLVRGVGRTVEEHLTWLERTGRHGAYWFIEEPLYYRRSQAVPAVMARWLRALPEGDRRILVQDPWLVRHPDGSFELCDITGQYAEWMVEQDPDQTLTTWVTPGPPQGLDGLDWPVLTDIRLDRYPRWAVADLPADTVRLFHKAFTAAVIVFLLWATWGPTRGGPTRSSPTRDEGRADADWLAQASLWILAMFWLTPYLTHNYLIWAYPPIAFLAAWAATADPARHGAARRALVAAVLFWTAAQLGRFSNPAQFYGIHLLATMVLGAAALVVVRAERANA